MCEPTITLSLFDAALSFDCIAGLPYELKEPVKICGNKAIYAVPHYTSPKCWVVDCTLLDKNFNEVVTWAEAISTEQLHEPVFDRYLN